MLEILLYKQATICIKQSYPILMLRQQNPINNSTTAFECYLWAYILLTASSLVLLSARTCNEGLGDCQHKTFLQRKHERRERNKLPAIHSINWILHSGPICRKGAERGFLYPYFWGCLLGKPTGFIDTGFQDEHINLYGPGLKLLISINKCGSKSWNDAGKSATVSPIVAPFPLLHS